MSEPIPGAPSASGSPDPHRPRFSPAELARLQERERFLERELRAAQLRMSPGAGSAPAIDEETVTRLLG